MNRADAQSLLIQEGLNYTVKTQLSTPSFYYTRQNGFSLLWTQRHLWGQHWTCRCGYSPGPGPRISHLHSVHWPDHSSSFLVGSLQSLENPEARDPGACRGLGGTQRGRVSGLFGEVTLLLRVLGVKASLSVCSKHREEQITLQKSEGTLWRVRPRGWDHHEQRERAS